MLNAFDRFVSEQLEQPGFARQYEIEGAKIQAMDLVKSFNPDRPYPKYQVSFFIEEPRPKGKPKRIDFRGAPVGLRSNRSCGTIEYAVWGEKQNQWNYTLFPWSGMSGKKTTTEEVLVPIQDWVDERLGDETVSYLRSEAGLSCTRAQSLYQALLSARCGDTYEVFFKLKQLIKSRL